MAFAGGQVLELALEATDVGIEDVAFEGTKASTQFGDFIDGCTENAFGGGEVVSARDGFLDAIATARAQAVEELDPDGGRSAA